jgi:hypothetical protein
MFAINRSLALKVNPNQAPITTDDIAIAANKAAINTRPVEAASTAASAEAKIKQTFMVLELWENKKRTAGFNSKQCVGQTKEYQ